MAARKQFQSGLTVTPELKSLLEKARQQGPSEEELKEQRISFAFGNAPASSDGMITKESVRNTSTHIRLNRP
jgi:hypothetical protein